MNILSYILEFIFGVVLFIPVALFISVIVYYISKKILKELKLTKYLLLSSTYFLLLLIGEVICNIILYLPLSKFIKLNDPWVSFLSFKPIHWERLFEGVDSTFYEPLSPLFTTGQVANIYYGMAILLPIIILFPFLIIFRKKFDFKTLYIIGSLFIIFQYLILGAISLFY